MPLRSGKRAAMTTTYTDNQVLKILRDRLVAGLASTPFVGPFVPVVLQKQQPVQQGIPSGPVIYFEKLMDIRYGWSAIKYDYALITDDFKEQETQLYMMTVQISAFVTQDPANLSQPTASDLCNLASAYVQCRSALRELAAKDIGLLRVTEVRNPYFTSDEDRQAATPSFDVVLTYARDMPNPRVPRVRSVDGEIIEI